MRRTKNVSDPQAGPVTYEIAECDHCGRGIRLDGTDRLVEVRQTGPLTLADFTELDFCSVECHGRPVDSRVYPCPDCGGWHLTTKRRYRRA